MNHQQVNASVFYIGRFPIIGWLPLYRCKPCSLFVSPPRLRPGECLLNMQTCIPLFVQRVQSPVQAACELHQQVGFTSLLRKPLGMHRIRLSTWLCTTNLHVYLL